MTVPSDIVGFSEPHLSRWLERHKILLLCTGPRHFYVTMTTMKLELSKNMFVWKPGYRPEHNAKMPRRLIPSDEQWEAHREHIIQLYIIDNMSLDRVMQTMQDWYQFRASRKMYKRRITQWNLRKYFTKKDVPEIKRQLPTGCRSGHLILPGRGVVDLARAESFLKRRSPASRRPSRSPQCQLRETTMCLFSASPLSISSPPEALLHSIQTYLDISSPNFIWYKDVKDRLCISGAGGISGRFRLSRFHDRLLVAVNGFTHHSSPSELQKSKEVMEECMDEMKIILREQDPFLLPDIFHILLQIRKHQPPRPRRHDSPSCEISDTRKKPLELDQVFVEYGKDLSAITLSETHPLTLVWSALYDAIKLNSETQMIYRALELVLDRFEAQVGPYHAISLIMRLHLFGAREDPKWKQVLIDLVTILEGGRFAEKGFDRLRWVLAMNEFTQQQVTGVIKFVCRLLRARLCSETKEGEDLLLEDELLLDSETELIQCLVTAPAVHY